MRNVVIDRGGFRYKWLVQGLNEAGCANDIQANERTELTDYAEAMFADRYGCVVSLERVRLMSHNQYHAFLQHNFRRLDMDGGYTLGDYRRDAKRVEVVPFPLEKYGLDGHIQAYIESKFDTISFTEVGDACLRCFAGSSTVVRLMAEELYCDSVCNQGYSGFFKNDRHRLVLDYFDGDVALYVCKSQKSYADRLNELGQLYEIDESGICLEVYFDNVHMDNIFLSRENVGVAISSLLQKGYDGYDSSVKACWENLLGRDKNPQIGFRAVESPAMVRDIDFVLSEARNRCKTEEQIDEINGIQKRHDLVF